MDQPPLSHSTTTTVTTLASELGIRAKDLLRRAHNLGYIFLEDTQSPIHPEEEEALKRQLKAQEPIHDFVASVEDHERFAALREVLQLPPSEEHWWALCALFEDWSEEHSREMALTYADAHLEAWPDRLRIVSLRRWWPTFPEGEPDPLCQLGRSLSCHNREIGQPGFQALANAAHLCALRRLHLRRCELTAESLRTLVGSPYLRDLRALNIASNPLHQNPEEAAHLLTQTPHLAGLEEFDVSATMLGSPLAQGLAQSPYISQLQHLNLHANHLIDDDLIQLAHSPNSRHLHKLILSENSIQMEGFEALCASEHLGQLEELNLSGNPLGQNAYTIAFCLRESGNFPRLKRLMCRPSYLHDVPGLSHTERERIRSFPFKIIA